MRYLVVLFLLVAFSLEVEGKKRQTRRPKEMRCGIRGGKGKLNCALIRKLRKRRIKGARAQKIIIRVDFYTHMISRNSRVLPFAYQCMVSYNKDLQAYVDVLLALEQGGTERNISTLIRCTENQYGKYMVLAIAKMWNIPIRDAKILREIYVPNSPAHRSSPPPRRRSKK